MELENVREYDCWNSRWGSRKIAESLGLGKSKAPQKVVIEVKDIGGRIVITAESTKESVAEGGLKLEAEKE